MSEEIDLYYEWLGIKPEDQPPNHYQLLGVDLFESDEAALARAADERMVYVRTFATGRHAKRSQGVLNEIAAAKLCLLDERRRGEYNTTLKAAAEPPVDVEVVDDQLAASVPPPAAPPVAVVEEPSQTATADVAPRAEVSTIAPSSGGYRRRRPQSNIWGIIAGAAIAVLMALVFFAALNTHGTKNNLSGDQSSNKQSAGYRDGDSSSPKAKESEDDLRSTPTIKQQRNAARNRKPKTNTADELSETDATRPAVDEPFVLPDPIDVPPNVEEPQEKQPVPADAALSPVTARVEHFFDIKGATTAKDKRALAQRLFEKSLQSDAYLEQFVLLDYARKLAVAAHDLQTAVESVNWQSKLFEVDQLGLLGSVVSSIEYSEEQPNENAAVAKVGLSLIDRALADDRYDLAIEIADAITKPAHRSSSPDLPQQVQEAVRGIRLIRRPFDQLKPSLETLENNPEDAVANTAVGRFYCFVKGDWQRGLPHLARGNHLRQKQLSERELAEERLPEETFAIAEGWFSLADDEEALLPSSISRQQEQILRHALSLYEAIVQRLPASKQSEAQTQIATTKRKLEGDSAASPVRTTRAIWYMNEVSMQPFAMGKKGDGKLRQTTDDPRAPFRGTGVFFQQSRSKQDLIFKIEWDKRIRQITLQVRNARKLRIQLLDNRTERPLGGVGPYNFGSQTKEIVVNVPAAIGGRFYLHLHNEAKDWFYLGGVELR